MKNFAELKDKRTIARTLLLVLLGLSIIAFGALRSARAFEYEDEEADSTSLYTIVAGEEVLQAVNPGGSTMSGVVLHLRNVTRSGVLKVTLLEDGSPVCSTSMQAAFLDDCGYQSLRFDKGFECDIEKEYSLSLKYEAEDATEGGIEFYASSGGTFTSSVSGTVAENLVCQNLYVNTQLQKAFILLLSIITIMGMLLLVRFADLNQEHPVKLLILTVLLIAFLEVLSTDLMPSILRNVAITSYDSESEEELILVPGDSAETTFDVTYAAINRVEIIPVLYKYDGLNLYACITDEGTGDTVFEGSYTEAQVGADAESGEPVISLSVDGLGQKLPLGSYKITVRNDGTMPFALSATETEDGLQMNTMQFIYSWIGYWVAFGILLLLAILLIGIVICVRRTASIEKYFLVIAIPLSIVYLILFQPWNGNDPNAHYAAIYRLSNILLGYDAHDAWYMRVDDLTYFDARMQLYHRPTGFYSLKPSMYEVVGSFYDLEEVTKHLFVQDATMVPWQSYYGHMEGYSIFSYLPEVLGFTLGRILHLGSMPAVYLSRVFLLVTYIVCMYHAIRVTPIGKYLYMVFAVLPMPLVIASEVSYDGMVLIVTVCFTSSVLRLSAERDSLLCRRFLIETAFWTFVLGAVKGGGYLIFLPLVLILLSRDLKKSLKLIAPILSAALVSVVLFDLILPEGGLFQLGAEGGAYLSSSWGFANPVEFFDMLSRTYISNADDLLLNMGGIPEAFFGDAVPFIVVVAIMFAGIYGAIYENDHLLIRPQDKIMIAIVLVLALLFVPIMLLSATTCGNAEIAGLQGRYFMPILPLVGLVLSKFLGKNNLRFEGDTDVVIRKCTICVVFLSALAVYTMMRCYLTS